MDTILIGSKSFGVSEAVMRRLKSFIDTTSLNIIYHNNPRPIPYNKVTGIIAGTEPYHQSLLKKMPNLKVISRMGVGYEQIDLEYCAAHNITVTYTPYGPTQSVAECTIAYILMLARNLSIVNKAMHDGNWHKDMGYQISELSIGILGAGRIGKTVIGLLQKFMPHQLYVCDTNPKIRDNFLKFDLKWVDIDKLFKYSNFVTLHIPLGDSNYHIVTTDLLNSMPSNAAIINTSRGGLIDEEVLCSALSRHTINGAAIDVFEQEPYTGILEQYDNVILSPHISSMTLTARHKMEIGALDDCIAVLNNKQPMNGVPYDSSK